MAYRSESGRIEMRDLNALWDTGATHTTIRREIADEMGIPMGDQSKMQMGVTVTPSNYCPLHLLFPDDSHIYVPDGVAVAGSRNELVIGMDILKMGTTTIRPDGEGGVWFTFRI